MPTARAGSACFAPSGMPEKNTRGAVSAVVGGGNPDSGGTQFFICVADQPGLDGVYDVFGRVSEGILVAQKISEVAADEKGRPKERIAIRSVTIRDKPAAGPKPFSTESAAELSGVPRRARDQHGQHHRWSSRRTKRRSTCGIFCGSRRPASTTAWAFHRVAKGFVIQTGICRREASRCRSRSSGSCATCSPSSTTRRT